MAPVGDSLRDAVIGFVFAYVACSHIASSMKRSCLAERMHQSPMLVKCHVTLHLPTGFSSAAAASQLHPVPQQQAGRMDDGIQACGTAFFQKEVLCNVKPREKGIVVCNMGNNKQ